VRGKAFPHGVERNARLFEAGPLPSDEFESIRARWREMATPEWMGME
jgi:hypothetical protein